MNEKINDLSTSILKSISHPTRVRILQLLENGPLCVCEIIEDLQLEQSNVSQHLAILRNQGIISSYRDGSKVIYKTEISEIYKVLSLVQKIVLKQISTIHKEVLGK